MSQKKKIGTRRFLISLLLITIIATIVTLDICSQNKILLEQNLDYQSPSSEYLKYSASKKHETDPSTNILK
jgi:hypothetical protein